MQALHLVPILVPLPFAFPLTILAFLQTLTHFLNKKILLKTFSAFVGASPETIQTLLKGFLTRKYSSGGSGWRKPAEEYPSFSPKMEQSRETHSELSIGKVCLKQKNIAHFKKCKPIR